MNDGLKTFYNPSAEEEYHKYIDMVKQELSKEKDNLFKAEYLQRPAFTPYRELREKRADLIDLIMSTSRTDPYTRSVIDHFLYEERKRKDKVCDYSVADLIQFNLNEICYILLSKLILENESLTKQVQEIYCRQPVRYVEVEKGVIKP